MITHEFFSLPKLYMVIIPCTLLDLFSFLHMKIASNFLSLHYVLIVMSEQPQTHFSSPPCFVIPIDYTMVIGLELHNEMNTRRGGI